MSFAKLFDQMRSAFDQKDENKRKENKALDVSLDILSKAAKKTEDRSKRIKEDKIRGVRGTRHRISL
ncbi:hypothetical protein Amal_01738 [Acetobacter malorum]|uniref:Uncharacterized protein n=1 Tax=Acetobacter malorum TaxID=178901 RepID=A0A177G6P0_9PROT|nr:hypothetical protein [Acetobacter malorum]OAG75968.1 hypothetical protein Amal_01738 [Acetobacter malorum]